MVGKTVGKYRVIERIGRGGMGIVYKAVDETLDRHVAIKVLNADFGDAAILKRFRAEAVTLARLNHPGIATIYELNRQDDELMMVMEFVRGETLHQFADRVGPLDPPHAAHLCMQVLDGLSHAHRAGVVHRDLKPANLMVTETGAVKVMDFGIARVLGAENYTLGGLTMGTPAYMSPEQVTGQPIDARADLYAVGVVFYRLLSGRLPFVADTAIAMAQKQISEQPTPLSEIRADLPQWCNAIVERALAKDPAERFQSAEEFRIALATAVIPQSISELPTVATPTLGTSLSNPPTTRTNQSPLESNAIALPTTGVTKESTGSAERTSTTVVLGRTHLFALAALFVVLTAGVVVLAIAAFRGAATPAAPASSTPPSTSVPAESQAPPTSTESTPTESTADAAAMPSSQAARGTTPPVEPPSPKPAGPAAGPAQSSPTGANPPTAATAAKAPEASTAEAKPTEPASPLPAVAFGNVRLLVTDGDRLRDRRGVLRLADGEMVMAGADSATRLLSLNEVTGINYSRSRHPRWRDESGKEVVPKVDLGRFGFFRGDRNWLILTTAGEPVILSVEDAQLRHVIDALQARTGLTVRRFQ